MSHDSTFTAYRQMIIGQSLTREDFLQETGWVEGRNAGKKGISGEVGLYSS